MILGKPVARLWARCAGEGDGLIIGAALQNEDGTCPFEPNTVYEVIKCALSGDMIIRKVGQAAVRGTEDINAPEEDLKWMIDNIQCPHIANEYNHLMSSYRANLILSAKELRALYERSNEVSMIEKQKD